MQSARPHQSPHPDRIFHNTSIDTLALILKSRRIRFSRLDRVDDSREAPTIQGIHFSKYFFVSCWTGEKRESIPQWQLYTEKMTGVRIELPSYPFREKHLTPPPSWLNTRTQGLMTSPLDFGEMFGPSHMVLPMFLNRDYFAGRVEYLADVADVDERYKSAVSFSSNNLAISRPFDLVRLKTIDWAFQDEYRFALFVLPSLPLPPDGPANAGFCNALPQHIANSFQTGRDPGITYLDVDLTESALYELVVTTGPLCLPGAKLCVDSLVKQYAPLGRVQGSSLEGRIRPR